MENKKGGLIYINSKNSFFATLTNVEYYNAGNIDRDLKFINFEGLIAR